MSQKEIYALHSATDTWQIDLWAKYEERGSSDLWHDVVGWVLDCELCDLCGSWFPCAESINYPCLAPCPQLGHAGCGDLPQMRENWRHPNPRSDLPRPNHCHCRTDRPWWTFDRVLCKCVGLVSPQWWWVYFNVIVGLESLALSGALLHSYVPLDYAMA